MSSTLVTGGLGYTGRRIVAQLEGQGRRVINYNRDYSEIQSDLVVPVYRGTVMRQRTAPVTLPI